MADYYDGSDGMKKKKSFWDKISFSRGIRGNDAPIHLSKKKKSGLGNAANIVDPMDYAKQATPTVAKKTRAKAPVKKPRGRSTIDAGTNMRSNSQFMDTALPKAPVKAKAPVKRKKKRVPTKPKMSGVDTFIKANNAAPKPKKKKTHADRLAMLQYDGDEINY